MNSIVSSVVLLRSRQ